jgi:hypothetical protein
MDGWMGGWVGGSVDEWIDEWMDGRLLLGRVIPTSSSLSLTSVTYSSTI